MSGFLLETNCISELVRIRPEPTVIKWLERADDQTLDISVLTLGEIRKGVAAASKERQAQLKVWLDVDLRKRFESRTIPVDAPIADRWGVLVTEAKRAGKTLPVIDSLLAGTALHLNLTVVSRNVGDFRNADVPVLNLWSV